MKRHIIDKKKIFVSHISDKGLTFRIHKQFSKLNSKKIKQKQEKMNKSFGHFTKEDIWMANKYMKKISTLLVISGMQIKTTMGE